MSRNHAIIEEIGGKLYLKDLASHNGISINAQKISQFEISGDFEFIVVNLLIRIQVEYANIQVSKAFEDEVTAPGIDTIPELLIESPPVLQPKMPTSPFVPAPQMPLSKPPAKTAFGIKLPAFIPTTKPVERRSTPRVPVIAKNFGPTFTELHPSISQAKHRTLEAIVTWHDTIYEVKEFFPTEVIHIGPKSWVNVSVPVLAKNQLLAQVGVNGTRCYFQDARKVGFKSKTDGTSYTEIPSQKVQKSRTGSSFILDPMELASFDFGSGMKVHLRYVPASRQLAPKKLLEPEAALKQSLITSLALHVLIFVSIFITAPPQTKGPHLKNVPDRYARLLVEKPKPPEKKPEPPKTPEKKPEPIKEPPKKAIVQKQKIMKLPKALAKVNKFPMEVKTPTPKAPAPVKVENLGALGALGAISKSAPSNVVTNININKDAGGLPSKSLSTGGIAGALPSSNGKLAAAGGPRVKTKGFGYGSGTGYGIQGLKGTAGTRGVEGAVVGQPKIAELTRQEGLSRSQVMAVVQKYLGEVQHCYERNLLSNPDLSGRMEFEWDISPIGKVTDVRVKRSTVNSGDGLGECVKGVFMSMAFPRATNGLITTPSIGFPFGKL